MNIEENQEQFLEEMSRFKSDLINTLSSENVEKYRKEYKGRYSPERFKEFFIEKAALHTLFKYILIRMIEESMGRVKVKLNETGIKNWQGMSKNFREDYALLFDFAIKDVRREDDFRNIFKNTVYDESHLRNRIKSVKLEYIPKLARYEFQSVSESSILTIINTLYAIEKRMEIQSFHQESLITNFLLELVGLLSAEG